MRWACARLSEGGSRIRLEGARRWEHLQAFRYFCGVDRGDGAWGCGHGLQDLFIGIEHLRSAGSLGAEQLADPVLAELSFAHLVTVFSRTSRSRAAGGGIRREIFKLDDQNWRSPRKIRRSSVKLRDATGTVGFATTTTSVPTEAGSNGRTAASPSARTTAVPTFDSAMIRRSDSLKRKARLRKRSVDPRLTRPADITVLELQSSKA